MRLKARVDVNQKQLVADLRKLGASVECLHQVGKGCPDLLVCFQSKLYLMEVKRDTKARLTTDQIEWIAKWKGIVNIITCIEDCMRIFKQKPFFNGMDD